MAEQSGERRVKEEVAAELISVIVPDMDPELVQVMLSRAARGAADGRPDHEGHRPRGVTSPAVPLQEYADLLMLIRDAGIDRGQLRAILGLGQETLPAGDDNPHPPLQ